MVTIIALVLVSLTVLVNGQPATNPFKDDFIFTTPKGHRLAGLTVNGNGKRCDLTRPQTRVFGYCFDDENVAKGIDTTKQRGWIREVVQQWEKCGGIQIKEEKECRKGADFITIHVGNYHPVVYPEVDTTNCTIKGFNMYFDFYTFGVNIEWFKRTDKIWKSSIQMYALHEFGHFLGFDHEHNRADRKDDCSTLVDAPSQGDNPYFGDNPITAQYDLDSIMNYCRPQVFFKPWLSKIDKEGMKQKYGGGNAQECDAVTQPWTWSVGDGLSEDELEYFNPGSKTTPKPTTTPVPVCADVASQYDCEIRIPSCKDEAMKYWCPKTCKYCQ